MSVRTVVTYPHPTLLRLADEVPDERFGDTLAELANDMAETMYVSDGIGLAAPQLDEPIRMLVMDIDWPRKDESELFVLVNPVLVETRGEQVYEEGCLSFPGIMIPIDRFAAVKVEARDPWGETFALEAEGLMAVCIQHEMDHLDGVTLVDRARGKHRQRLLAEMRTKPWFRPELVPDGVL